MRKNNDAHTCAHARIGTLGGARGITHASTHGGWGGEAAGAAEHAKRGLRSWPARGQTWGAGRKANRPDGVDRRAGGLDRETGTAGREANRPNGMERWAGGLDRGAGA